MPVKQFLLLSILLSIIGCGENTEDAIQFLPPPSSDDPKNLMQYAGVWETECYFESDYYPPPSFEARSVYKKITFSFATDKAERIEKRFDDSTCEQYTSDTGGLNVYYYASLARYRVPFTVVEADFGVLVGVFEFESIWGEINEGNVVEISNPTPFYRLIYRTKDRLVVSEFAREIGDEFYPLNWTNQYKFVGDARFEL